MSEKIIGLCKKLKALAERGVGGEKINAMRALQNLMDKHNLTIEDIECEKKDYAHFKVSSRQGDIFYQIVASVIGDYSIYTDKRKKGYKVLLVTASDAIEIEMKYSFYWRLYKQELEIFREAFIARNNIYNPNGKKVTTSEMTKDQLDRAKRVLEMADSIKKGNLLKQLSNG